MTMIDEHTTLGELVTANPGLARELERLGLDYCCGGARTVREACAEQRLDPDVVVAELAGAATDEEPAPWAAMEPAELVDHLASTHHRYLWEELPRLSTLLAKIVTVHGTRHPELHEVRRIEHFRRHLAVSRQALPLVCELRREAERQHIEIHFLRGP